MTVRSSTGVASAQVAVQSQSVAAAAGIHGVVLAVSRADGGSGSARLGVDVSYASFRDAYGGDYAGRLRLVRMPACVLSTPELPACQVQTPLAGATNNQATQTVSADAVDIPATGVIGTAGALAEPANADAGAGLTVLAVTAGGTGAAGSWGPASLTQVGSWASGGQAGDFTYTYPFKVPASLGGPSPSLALRYSSQSVDARTLSQNDQASWVGEVGPCRCRSSSGRTARVRAKTP